MSVSESFYDKTYLESSGVSVPALGNSTSWYTTVVFKGSNNTEQTCRVTVPKSVSVQRFAEIVLNYFKIKDVLAVVEFSKYIDKSKSDTHIVDPGENFWEAVNAYGTIAYVYTDAELPKRWTK